MQTNKFARKPFYVDAVQVNSENLSEVAEWCQGEVRSEDTVDPRPYVKVRVHRPLTERQTKAFDGDWVLYAGTGFKVYTPKAFEKSFERVTTLSKAQADEAGVHPPIENAKAPEADHSICEDGCTGGPDCMSKFVVPDE